MLLSVALTRFYLKNILTSYAEASDVEEPPTPPPTSRLRRLKKASVAEEINLSEAPKWNLKMNSYLFYKAKQAVTK
jgi:hypothetical protein